MTIGITGPTGCGKTTLLQEIAARAAGVIVDCDALYYELLKTERGAASRRCKQRSGDAFRRGRRACGRKALGQLVFGDTGAHRRSSTRSSFSTSAGAVAEARARRRSRTGEPLFAIDAINLSRIRPGRRSAIRRSAFLRRSRRASRASWRATSLSRDYAARARWTRRSPDELLPYQAVRYHSARTPGRAKAFAGRIALTNI